METINKDNSITNYLQIFINYIDNLEFIRKDRGNF
jgi:hypothetical protein